MDDLSDTLKTYIINSDIKNTNIITAKMMISCDYKLIWIAILEVYIEYIGVDSINLLSYIKKKLIFFSKTRPKNTPEFKCQVCRNLMSQLVTILCLVPKSKLDLENNTNNNSKLNLSTFKWLYKYVKNPGYIKLCDYIITLPIDSSVDSFDIKDYILHPKVIQINIQINELYEELGLLNCK